ncbi:MAG TPA: hypothetical protein VGM81_12280 [Burkholderiaceae bacterium]
MLDGRDHQEIHGPWRRAHHLDLGSLCARQKRLGQPLRFGDWNRQMFKFSAGPRLHTSRMTERRRGRARQDTFGVKEHIGGVDVLWQIGDPDLAIRLRRSLRRRGAALPI